MGGAETWLVALLEWLAQNGDTLPVDVQVDICLTGGERAVLDDRVAALGATLHYLRYEGRHIKRFRKDFRRLLANGRYDAIHDHADYAAGIHLLCGLGNLPPVRVVHVHSRLPARNDSLSRRSARHIGRWAVLHLASTVAGTSMQILRDYDLKPTTDATQRRLALHCGFDLVPFAEDPVSARRSVRAEFGWSTDAKVLLFVGRLESDIPQKNPRVALNIARECVAKNPRVRALLVGAGDVSRRQIESELAAEGLADAIRLPGIRFDVARLMLASDLLLFPSVAEGLGMVAVEAQAAGLRVLASDTTPRECVVVAELVTFISLAKPIECWADLAMRLLDSPEPDRQGARTAVDRSPFSITSSVMALFDVYGFVSASPP